MFAPAEVATNYVGLLDDASVRPCPRDRQGWWRQANVQSREIERVWTVVKVSLWLR